MAGLREPKPWEPKPWQLFVSRNRGRQRLMDGMVERTDGWAPNCWGEDSAKQQRGRRHRRRTKPELNSRE